MNPEDAPDFDGLWSWLEDADRAAMEALFIAQVQAAVTRSYSPPPADQTAPEVMAKLEALGLADKNTINIPYRFRSLTNGAATLDVWGLTVRGHMLYCCYGSEDSEYNDE